MRKQVARERLEAALKSAVASLEPISQHDAALDGELRRIRSDVGVLLGGWLPYVDDDSVETLQARLKALSGTAEVVAAILREAAAGLAEIEQLIECAEVCGPELFRGVDPLIRPTGEKLRGLGLDVVRRVDADNDRDTVRELRLEITRLVSGVERLQRASKVLEQLRQRRGGSLPRSGADLYQSLPDLEREFVTSRGNAAWRSRLDRLMVEPLREWDNPPLPPEELNKARALFEQLRRWGDVLGARTQPIVVELEEELVLVENGWQEDASMDANSTLQRIERTLADFQADARAIREERAAAIVRDLTLLRGASLDAPGLEGLVERLRTTEVRSAEHHERWQRDEVAARTNVHKAVHAASTTDDLGKWLEAEAGRVRQELTGIRGSPLTRALVVEVAQLERDIGRALDRPTLVEGWLSSLRVVGSGVERARGIWERQRAALERCGERVDAVEGDRIRASTAAATVGVTPDVTAPQVAACRVWVAEESIEALTERIDDIERRLQGDVDRIGRAQIAAGQHMVDQVTEMDHELTALGAPAAELAPRCPEDWRARATWLGGLARRVEQTSQRHVEAVGRTREELDSLLVALEGRRGAVLPVEDREQLSRVLARIQEVRMEPRVAPLELLDVTGAARELLEQLTEAERRLEGWYRVLLERLGALRDEGFRAWNPELAHRASALLKGITSPPPVAWVELEAQLTEADRLLRRLEEEGLRRAAGEVEVSITAITRALQRQPDPQLQGLLSMVQTCSPDQLPPRAARTRLRDTAKRLK